MKMDERKYRILQAIIDDYIMTGMPVGSRTISRKYDVGGLSSATIRNEMSDLEEMGFLDQPHTSAGRVPSNLAYRLYVENLLSGTHTLQPEDVARLKDHFGTRARQVEDVLSNAAQAISDVTNYTAVVLPPKMRASRVRRIQLVPVSDSVALLLVITDGGVIRDTQIHLTEPMSADDLHLVSNLLTDQLSGLSAGEVAARLRELTGRFGEHRRMLEQILDAVEDERDDGKYSVAVGGRSNILSYPEYSDSEKARAVLAVLEKRDKLMQLIQSAPQMAFTIRIGAETGMPETNDCSVVSMTYRVGEEGQGCIGVIGPTRMRYGRVISVLDFMGKALSELLQE